MLAYVLWAITAVENFKGFSPAGVSEDLIYAFTLEMYMLKRRSHTFFDSDDIEG